MTSSERPQPGQLWTDPDGFDWCVLIRDNEWWFHRPEMYPEPMNPKAWREVKHGRGPEGWRRIPRDLSGWELTLYADNDPRNEQEAPA